MFKKEMVKIYSQDENVSGCVYMSVITGKIVSIELLEGDVEITADKVVQYVNIEHNKNEHVDGTNITHTDRLGRELRCKVRFDRAGVFLFKVKLIPGANNVVYSPAEKNRNPVFNYSKDEIEFTTDRNGEKIIEAGPLFVSSAGKDVFTLSATDVLGNEVRASAKIKTRRLLYYTEMKMRGLTLIKSDMNIFVNEYRKHGILFKAEPSLEVPHRPNIDDPQQFSNDVTTEYQKSTSVRKSPYCVCIVYTEQLAVKKPGLSFRYPNVEGGYGKKIDILLHDMTMNLPYFLWYNIDPAEDWFVKCHFMTKRGVIMNNIRIPKAQCTIKSTPGMVSGHYNLVEVDLSGVPPEKGTLVLTVNCVDRMRGGISMSALVPTAIVCTKSWWNPTPESQQNNIVVHEVGHRLGMVSDGSGKFPDKPACYYDHSHIGRHCHKGIVGGLRDYKSMGILSECVMFGETTDENTFCDDCAETVKKLDLSEGFV